MRAFKFLTADGRGVFSGFAWPLPDARPGSWVESEIDPCRSGIHACRTADLPYWLTPALYEIELESPIDEQVIKVVAPRGRLTKRVDEWDAGAQEAFGQMCLDRAQELAASVPERLAGWVPTSGVALTESARLGFIAARIAEELGGFAAHLEERNRQSAWLIDRLALD